MAVKNKYFGKIIGVDALLMENQKESIAFSLRGRSKNSISLFNLDGKLLTIVDKTLKSGPDCICCESLPGLDIELPEDGWKFEEKFLKIPYVSKLDLSACLTFDSMEYSAIADFPGHMEHMITRSLRDGYSAAEIELRGRLEKLAKAIRAPLAESVEIPVLEVIGFGPGRIPIGDGALAGMLLTLRCFALGKRLKVNWHSRFAMEVRRFIHRTSSVGKNWLRYALEGRTTSMQTAFFKAMAEDFECADEIMVSRLAQDEEFSGKAFLMGAQFALEMIRKNFL
jgi:hypothetical protein